MRVAISRDAKEVACLSDLTADWMDLRADGVDNLLNLSGIWNDGQTALGGLLHVVSPLRLCTAAPSLRCPSGVTTHVSEVPPVVRVP